MGGSRATTPKRAAAAAVSFAVAALAAVPAANAADFGQPPAVAQSAVGQPVVLFPRDAPAAAPGGFAHHAGAAMPAKHPSVPMHPVVPVQRKPLDGRPLIPPAAVPAKLGPPPAPRPALSLETDLRPLTPAPATGAASASRQATPSG